MHVEVNPLKRLAYAGIGLLAGDAVLLLYVLYGAILNDAYSHALYMGARGRLILVALEVFIVYALFSFAGWLFVGVPTALFFPARSITRLPWLLTLLVGATLGPLALAAVLIVLAHGHLDVLYPSTGTSGLWVYSIVVSTVAFGVYAFLLRKETSAADT
jgi:hypothetical protein